MAEQKTIRQQNEDQLDLLADLMEPVAEIFADKAVREAFENGSVLKAIKPAIKNHKGAVIEILARLHGESPETYKVNALMLPVELTRLINKPEVQDFLSSLGQTADETGSGSAMENIAESAK